MKLTLLALLPTLCAAQCGPSANAPYEAGTTTCPPSGPGSAGSDPTLPSPPAVAYMQPKQCVADADGKMHCLSIPIGQNLSAPRIQRRFEDMFGSPMAPPLS